MNAENKQLRHPRILRRQRGFTLIEMIVSVALFSIVMLVAGATLFSLVYANKKAQAVQSVMNNLNISLDGMVRAMRQGTEYHCGSPTANPADCPNGQAQACNVSSSVYFAPFGDVDPTNSSTYWGYIYDPSTQAIYKTTDGDTSTTTSLRITAPEVIITCMKFSVVGTTPGDTVQPKIFITLLGNAGTQGQTTRTSFNIQATALQRVLDIQ